MAAEDGDPLINALPHNEWVYWDAWDMASCPTTSSSPIQIIASVEYNSQSIHSAHRGGLTMGTATHSKGSRFGTYVFLSTFPFIGTNDFLSELRSGDAYHGEELARLAGAGLAYEIGHQLFPFGHPSGNPACVMYPVPLLRFRELYEGLNATKCRVGREPAMTPGAVEIYHDPDL